MQVDDVCQDMDKMMPTIERQCSNDMSHIVNYAISKITEDAHNGASVLRIHVCFKIVKTCTTFRSNLLKFQSNSAPKEEKRQKLKDEATAA